MKKTMLIVFCLQLMANPLVYAAQCETAIQCQVMQSSTNREVVSAGAANTNTANTAQPGRVTSSQRGISSAGTGTSGTPGANFGTGNSGAYQQAQQAKDDAAQKQMMGMMIAAASMPMCGPKNPYACILAAAGIALAALAGGKKNKAQNLQNQLGVGTAGTANTNGTSVASDADGGVGTEGELTELKGKLAKNGYAVGEDGTITGPGGQSANAFNLNPSSLRGMGLNAKQAGEFASDFEKQAAEAGKKVGLKTASTGGDDSGGGASGMGSFGMSSSEVAPTNNAKVERTSLDRDPAAWAGFYKQHGDSLVGVAQGDIFLMIQNRIEIERKPMGH